MSLIRPMSQKQMDQELIILMLLFLVLLLGAIPFDKAYSSVVSI